MPKIGPGQGKQEASPIPAGEYIIALVWFTRRVGRNSGKDYLRCKWEVCSGPLKGKAFFTAISCDTSKGPTVQRWSLLCEVCDVEDEFELGDTRQNTQNEGDANIRRLFLNKPFKATVTREQSNGYDNNDIQMIHYKRTWTQADEFEMGQWIREQNTKGASNPEDSAPDDVEPADDLPPVDSYDDLPDTDGATAEPWNF